MDYTTNDVFLENTQNTTAEAVVEAANKAGMPTWLAIGIGFIVGCGVMKATEYIRYEYGNRSMKALMRKFVPDFDPEVEFESDVVIENDVTVDENNNEDN